MQQLVRAAALTLSLVGGALACEAKTVGHGLTRDFTGLTRVCDSGWRTFRGGVVGDRWVEVYTLTPGHEERAIARLKGALNDSGYFAVRAIFRGDVTETTYENGERAILLQVVRIGNGMFVALVGR